MAKRRLITLVLFSFALTSPLLAQKKVVECGKDQSLNQALKNLGPGETLTFTGMCKESVSILVSGITLVGQGTAIISPGTAADAVSISGAQRVVLQNFTVENGRFGIHAIGGASIVLQNIVAQSNAQTGILIDGNSSAEVTNTTSQSNRLHGIDIESSSSIILGGNVLAQGNGVFGVNIATASSGTLNSGTLTSQQNVLGIQISIDSGFFLGSPAAAVNALNNFTVGLTMVSGAHFFSSAARF